MNLSKDINDKHILGISKLLNFMLLATETGALKRTPGHQTVLIVRCLIRFYNSKMHTEPIIAQIDLYVIVICSEGTTLLLFNVNNKT